jgi:hypothetical protein
MGQECEDKWSERLLGMQRHPTPTAINESYREVLSRCEERRGRSYLTNDPAALARTSEEDKLLSLAVPPLFIQPSVRGKDKRTGIFLKKSK